jgi:hypothetical protein
MKLSENYKNTVGTFLGATKRKIESGWQLTNRKIKITKASRKIDRQPPLT